MKTLFKLLAIGIVSVAACQPPRCEAQPTLADFGYGNMTTKRAIATAILLVNFTNANAGTNVSPYKMGGTLVGTNYHAAEQYYSNWFFAKTTSPESMNGFFNEISNGRFQWTPAIVYMLTVPTNVLYQVFLDKLTNGPAADSAYFTEMVGRAMDAGVDFMRYDQPANGGDGNGTLVATECTIQLLINDKTLRGGGSRWWNAIVGPLVYRDWVTFQEYDRGLRTIEEELVHVLQASRCGDIYGPSGMSAGFSSMSGGSVVHLDAWHKLHLAWCEPRRHSLREVGQFVLPAAQLMDSNGPVLLYDPVRGASEFFVLEYRTTNTVSAGSGYDAHVKDSGLVIWHAQQLLGDVVNYTATYFLAAQTNWRRCVYCRSLFDTNRTGWPCSQGTNVVHVAENAGDDEHIRLDATDGGEPGWHGCSKCGQLFYFPNIASSVCPAGGLHTSSGYQVRLRHNDDPEALGTRDWERCTKCQTLFRPRYFEEDDHWDRGSCAAGGTHTSALGEVPYTLLWNDGVKTIMTEGSPNLWRSRGDAWHGGDLTPPLRWFDGTRSTTRLAVRTFQPNADYITIDIVPNADPWVDFNYSGTEDGTFDRPFNTFAEGTDAVYPGAVLHIKSGTSSETRHVTKPMKIESYGGPAKIGHH